MICDFGQKLDVLSISFNTPAIPDNDAWKGLSEAWMPNTSRLRTLSASTFTMKRTMYASLKLISYQLVLLDLLQMKECS